MKKTILMASIAIISLMSCCISCSENESLYDELQQSAEFKTLKHKRSYKDALYVAEKSLSMLDDQETRSGYARHINQSDTRYILSQTTRANESADTLLYIFNFAENSGFAVVSANANVEGLLAVTEAGNYNEATLERNKGLAIFMELAKGYSRFPGLNPVIDTMAILSDYVNPLLEICWGQAFPEGLYFPNTVAGCNNTATALIASYLEYPTHLNLTFYNADTTDVNLNWTTMKQHFSGSHSYSEHTISSCNASVDAHKNIGRLVRQIANYNGSQLIFHGQNMYWNTPLPHNYYTYTEDQVYNTMTYTMPYKITNAFDSLGYTYTNPAIYTTKCTKSYLDNYRLVYMKGEAYVSFYNEIAHHAWIVDGYKDYIYVITNNNYVEPVTQTIYAYYNHINWGWNGDSNGYFNDGVFNTANAHLYDSSNHNHSLSFYDIQYCSVYR